MRIDTCTHQRDDLDVLTAARSAPSVISASAASRLASSEITFATRLPAVGMPAATVNGRQSAGRVAVVYGQPGGWH